MLGPETTKMLREHGLFGLLSDAALSRLTGGARLVRLSPGRTLFTQGDPSGDVYLVTEGRISVGTVSEAGQAVHFADLGPGALLGEFAVIDGAPRSAGAAAVTSTTLLVLSGARMLDALRDEPGFALALLRDLTAKVRAADGQIEDRDALSLRERLTKFLADNAQDGVVALTQTQIADRLGVSREAANRRLRALEAAGAVVLRRGRVMLTGDS